MMVGIVWNLHNTRCDIRSALMLICQHHNLYSSLFCPVLTPELNSVRADRIPQIVLRETCNVAALKTPQKGVMSA